jgi:hypothetical protein
VGKLAVTCLLGYLLWVSIKTDLATLGVALSFGALLNQSLDKMETRLYEKKLAEKSVPNVKKLRDRLQTSMTNLLEQLAKKDKLE